MANLQITQDLTHLPEDDILVMITKVQHDLIKLNESISKIPPSHMEHLAIVAAQIYTLQETAEQNLSSKPLDIWQRLKMFASGWPKNTTEYPIEKVLRAMSLCGRLQDVVGRAYGKKPSPRLQALRDLEADVFLVLVSFYLDYIENPDRVDDYTLNVAKHIVTDILKKTGTPWISKVMSTAFWPTMERGHAQFWEKYMKKYKEREEREKE